MIRCARPLLLLSAALPVCLLAGARAHGQTVTQLRTADYRHVDTSHLASIPESSNDPVDLRTEEQVREALLADRSLSSAGHRVRVLSFEGEVTLRGSVRTPQERVQVARDAAAAVGGYRVHNRISVSR